MGRTPIAHVMDCRHFDIGRRTAKPQVRPRTQSTTTGDLDLPVAAWEFSLGVWLVVKGFKPCPITAEIEAASSPPAYHDVTV